MDELASRQPTAATEASVDDVNTEPQAPNQPEEGATEQEEEEEKEELDTPRKSTDGVNFYAQPKVRTVFGLNFEVDGGRTSLENKMPLALNPQRKTCLGATIHTYVSWNFSYCLICMSEHHKSPIYLFFSFLL